MKKKKAAEKLRKLKEEKISNLKEGDYSCRLATERGCSKLRMLRERIERESLIVV